MWRRVGNCSSVRFDEGAGVPDNKGRPALLYTLGVPCKTHNRAKGNR